MKMNIDGWEIEVYETKGAGLGMKGKSPQGREFFCYVHDFGERLEEHGAEANVEFSSASLILTNALAARLKEACRRYNRIEAAKEPEYAGKNFV